MEIIIVDESAVLWENDTGYNDRYREEGTIMSSYLTVYIRFFLPLACVGTALWAFRSWSEIKPLIAKRYMTPEQGKKDLRAEILKAAVLMFFLVPILILGVGGKAVRMGASADANPYGSTGTDEEPENMSEREMREYKGLGGEFTVEVPGLWTKVSDSSGIDMFADGNAVRIKVIRKDKDQQTFEEFSGTELEDWIENFADAEAELADTSPVDMLDGAVAETAMEGELKVSGDTICRAYIQFIEGEQYYYAVFFREDADRDAGRLEVLKAAFLIKE